MGGFALFATVAIYFATKKQVCACNRSSPPRVAPGRCSQYFWTHIRPLQVKNGRICTFSDRSDLFCDKKTGLRLQSEFSAESYARTLLTIFLATHSAVASQKRVDLHF